MFNYKSIRGLVIDSKTRNPLPYSNVFLINKSTGTITNIGGRFELKISTSEPDDTLGVSFIGYKLYKMPVSSLDTGLTVVRLSSRKVQIREVIVKPLDPIYILTKSIEAIPYNYDRKPAVFTAFFRESTRQDNTDISLSEAVINIFKESYTSMQGRSDKNFQREKGKRYQRKGICGFCCPGRSV